jgi:hypothetical protein
MGNCTNFCLKTTKENAIKTSLQFLKPRIHI